jgi:hypothetical protein
VLEIRIPAGESRHVLVEYENELDLRSIDISKNDLRVYVLRKLSDFRDMIMFKTSIGRTLIVFYYNNKLNNLGLSWLGIFFLVLVVFVTSGGLYLRRWVKKRKV